jgi:hypothetical protein
MGEGGVQTLEQAIGCTIADAFTLLSGRGVVAPIGTRARKGPPSSVDRASSKAQKRLRHGDFLKAAEGTRTLDLLHGKQTHMVQLGTLSAWKSRLFECSPSVAIRQVSSRFAGVLSTNRPHKPG